MGKKNNVLLCVHIKTFLKLQRNLFCVPHHVNILRKRPSIFHPQTAVEGKQCDEAKTS